MTAAAVSSIPRRPLVAALERPLDQPENRSISRSGARSSRRRAVGDRAAKQGADWLDHLGLEIRVGDGIASRRLAFSAMYLLPVAMMRAGQAGDRLLERDGLELGLLDPCRELLNAPCSHGFEQFLTVGEVAVERCASDPRGGRDLLHARGAATLGKDHRRAVDDRGGGQVAQPFALGHLQRFRIGRPIGIGA